MIKQDNVQREGLVGELLESPLQAVVDYYATRLKEHQKANHFLQRSALCADSGTLPALTVGFSDRTLGLRVPKMSHKLGRQCGQS